MPPPPPARLPSVPTVGGFDSPLPSHSNPIQSLPPPPHGCSGGVSEWCHPQGHVSSEATKA